MLQVIEKLLILQDRDRRISKVETELHGIAPQRAALQAKMAQATSDLDAAKLRAKQIESDRKKLELEVESHKQRIDKYSTQQLQTKKNDEYKALTNEIENAKRAIAGLDDQQLELMEKFEAAQREIATITESTKAAQKLVEDQIKQLGEREKSLQDLLAQLKADYPQLQEAVEPETRGRYERLRKNKGGLCLVGIERSVCGGCHMRLPQQIVLSTQAAQEIISCPNCGRMLYYSREMDMVATS